MISRGLKKNGNARHFNVSKQGHVRRDCKQAFLETVFFLSIIQIELSLLDNAEGVAKADIGLMNVDQQGPVKEML